MYEQDGCFPLFEFDDDRDAVLAPDHEKLAVTLPEKAVFAFLGEEIDRFAAAHSCRRAAEFVSVTKVFPVYTACIGGEEVALCQAPVGAAAAAQLLDWLIAYGVRKIISAGTCGALCDFPENTFLVPVRALRDEGTSYHYAPPSRFIELDAEGCRAVRAALAAHGLPCTDVVTWTTDGVFRETRAKVQRRKDEGCAVVEMECSALAACARLRGAVFGMLLFTADTLADPERYDARSWGEDSFSPALSLCLEAVHLL